MKIEKIQYKNIQFAKVTSDALLITDLNSALDLMATVNYETGCSRILLSKAAVDEAFFRLSTCIAGDILQKFINYHMKLAVYGDYYGYTSKPLKDFIYECNQGKDFFFVQTEEEAIEKLGTAAE